MIKIIVIIFFTASLFFAINPAHSEEKAFSESSMMASIRPKIEYVTEGTKEPFLDYFTKNEPAAPTQAEAAAQAAKKEQLKPKPALPDLAVQGIIWGGNVPCAIINNKVVKEGESIDGVKLIKIEKENIEVLYQGWNYSLSSPAGLGLDQKPEGGENE